VTCTDALGVAVEARTDANGSFVFTALRPGEYRIALCGEGRPWPIHWRRGRPGGEELVLEAGAGAALEARAFDFVARDPACIPALVEIGVTSLQKATLVPVQRTSRSVDLLVPSGAAVVLRGWIPGYGVFVEHLPPAPPGSRRQDIVVPEPVAVSFLVETPPDVGSPRAIEGRLRRPGFGASLFDIRHGSVSLQELTPGPDGRTFTTRLFPGVFNYSFSAPGLAHRPRWITVRPGAAQVEVVPLVAAVPVLVVVRLDDEARTPQLSLELEGGELAYHFTRDVRRTGGQVEFALDLPPEARAVVIGDPLRESVVRVDASSVAEGGGRLHADLQRSP
jgi:hypothetical protein